MASIVTGNGAKKALKFLMGKCIPSFKENAAKIQVPLYEFDSNLNMHFKKYEYLYAHDPHRLCKTGDMVLLETLPDKLTRLITHKVIDVIYPCGDVTDPITGEKVVAGVYRKNIKEINEMYGGTENAFDYDKAPPRGSLEDIRDFTHKPAYKQYYEDPNDPQPYAV